GTVTDDSGVWARITGLHGRYAPRSSDSGAGYDVNQVEMQAGRDFQLAGTDTASIVGGVSARYLRTTGSSGTGVLSAEGFGLGASLTYYDESGLYLDGQAQGLFYSGDYSSSLMGGLADGATGLAYGVSLEGGRRLALGENW